MAVRTIALLLALGAGCTSPQAEETSASNGVVQIISKGDTAGHILLDGEFAGFTPATVQLNPSVDNVRVEYGMWGQESFYTLHLVHRNNGPAIARAEVEFPSESCLVRHPGEREAATRWASETQQKGGLPTELRLPGYAGIVKRCPQSPWFGESRYYDLQINSAPSGAEVRVEGEPVGKTPLQLKIKHDFAQNRMNQLRIAASLNGYLTASKVYVARGETTKDAVNLTLKPAR